MRLLTSVNRLRRTMKLPGNLRDGLMMMKKLLGGTAFERGIITGRNLFRHGRLLELKRNLDGKFDKIPIDKERKQINTAFVEVLR